MSVRYPLLLLVAVVGTGAAVTAYVLLQRHRRAVLAGSGLGIVADPRRRAMRRHLPVALFLAALAPLLLALARPQASVGVPRAAGTVILAFDVSNSMTADDVEPTRLAAVQAAATRFVRAQPDTVDIGVVLFGPAALATQVPTNDHGQAIAAIDRLSTGGGTSLGAAILTSLSTIVGEQVTLPAGSPGGVPGGSGSGDSGSGDSGSAAGGSAETPADLGYWGSATIVIFSDGEDTAGPDAEQAAALAAGAGVRIETVGVGTVRGTTIEVDGYQVATALDEELLASIARATGGSYHQPRDTTALNEVHRAIDLRITTRQEQVELTALLAGAGLLLLAAGGLLMIRWHGRLV